jgi:hypothetical protein
MVLHQGQPLQAIGWRRHVMEKLRRFAFEDPQNARFLRLPRLRMNPKGLQVP